MIMMEGMRNREGESHLLSMLPVTGWSNLPVLTTSVLKNHLESWLKMKVHVSLFFHLGLEPNHGSQGFIFLLFQSISLKIALGSQ